MSHQLGPEFCGIRCTDCPVCHKPVEHAHPKAVMDGVVAHYACADVEQSKRNNLAHSAMFDPPEDMSHYKDTPLEELIENRIDHDLDLLKKASETEDIAHGVVRDMLIEGGVDPDHWIDEDRPVQSLWPEGGFKAKEDKPNPHIGSDFNDFMEEDGVLIEKPDDPFTFVGDDVKGLESLANKGGITRIFESGATRDTDLGKLDFEAFFSPAVMMRYAEYMHKQRYQSNGQMRDGDNWQKGIPKKEYMKSMLRHIMDVWCGHRELHDLARADMIEALCALKFNVDGMLFECLQDEERYENTKRSRKDNGLHRRANDGGCDAGKCGDCNGGCH